MMDDDIFVRFITDYPDRESIYYQQLESYLTRWDMTKDSDYIDRAIMYAQTYSIPIKGVFLEIVADLARERFSRDHQAKSRISKKNKLPLNHYAHNQHLEVYRLNVYCGFNLGLSCALVALRAKKSNSPVQKKASTLEKEHTGWRRDNVHRFEHDFSFNNEKWKDCHIKDYLCREGYDINDPLLEEVKGNRRE